MGDPRKQHKKYKKPRKMFEKDRIEEENSILKKYGLKNKKEIWKAKSAIENIRKRAKSLISDKEKQYEFIEKLKKQGFSVSNIDDILSLEKEAWLDRRLQTILVKKKMANTPRQARQLIVHKHILVNGKTINAPSYLVPKHFEDKITKKIKHKKEKKKEQIIEQEVGEEE
ncbi:30S ribosomal protein S4 [Candidatus Pacearchaeota archaeon]|nr:30S ribosomal protein S4 [Candidatus Pacearchaeota archaeon]